MGGELVTGPERHRVIAGVLGGGGEVEGGLLMDCRCLLTIRTSFLTGSLRVYVS
jgi:hypothetical protein